MWEQYCEPAPQLPEILFLHCVLSNVSFSLNIALPIFHIWSALTFLNCRCRKKQLKRAQEEHCAIGWYMGFSALCIFKLRNWVGVWRTCGTWIFLRCAFSNVKLFEGTWGWLVKDFSRQTKFSLLLEQMFYKFSWMAGWFICSAKSTIIHQQILTF